MRRDPGAESSVFIPAAMTVAAVAAVYASSLPASFQFDDWNVIVDEPRVRTLRAFWESMPGIRPVLKATYALCFEAGFGAAGFRACNVAIHAANACLVLMLSTRLARRHGAASAAPWVGLACATMFALHPAQTEAVTYVSGRSSSLVALFALGSLLAWVRGRETESPWLLLGASPTLLLLALGTKETAVATPFAMLLWHVTDPRGEPRRSRDLALPFAFVLGAVIAAVAWGGTYRRLLDVSIAARGPVSSLATQAEGVSYLLGQLVRPGRLNADPVLPVLSGFTASSAIAAVALGGVIALGLAWVRRRPAAAFGILWTFVWLAPTNSLVPRLDVANDRQLYLAIVGPAWLLAWGAFRALREPRWILAGAALLSAVLAIATVRRNAVYADETTFWRDVTAKSPANGRAWNNLGWAQALAGRDREAEAAFLQALALDGGDVRAAVNLKLLREGKLERAPHFSQE